MLTERKTVGTIAFSRAQTEKDRRGYNDDTYGCSCLVGLVRNQAKIH